MFIAPKLHKSFRFKVTATSTPRQGAHSGRRLQISSILQLKAASSEFVSRTLASSVFNDPYTCLLRKQELNPLSNIEPLEALNKSIGILCALSLTFLNKKVTNYSKSKCSMIE